MMDLIRDKFVKGDLSSITDDESGIKLVAAEEFSYTDLPRKPRKSVADVLDKFYRDHNIKL